MTKKAKTPDFSGLETHEREVKRQRKALVDTMPRDKKTRYIDGPFGPITETHGAVRVEAEGGEIVVRDDEGQVLYESDGDDVWFWPHVDDDGKLCMRVEPPYVSTKGVKERAKRRRYEGEL